MGGWLYLAMTFVATNRRAAAARFVLKVPIPAPARDAVHWTNLPTPWWAGLASQQEGRTQSTGTSHRQDQPAGLARAGSHHLMASAERRARHSAHHDS